MRAGVRFGESYYSPDSIFSASMPRLALAIFASGRGYILAAVLVTVVFVFPPLQPMVVRWPVRDEQRAGFGIPSIFLRGIGSVSSVDAERRFSHIENPLAVR